jgi:hypothetical protein
MAIGSTWAPGVPVYKPDVRVRFIKRGTTVPDARAGTVLSITRGDRGPLNTPTELVSPSDLAMLFGTAGTTDAAAIAFNAGALRIINVRQGSGGAQAQGAVSDGTDPVVTVKARTVGSGGNGFTHLFRVAADPTKKEHIVSEGGVVRLVTTIVAGAGNEADALVAAINAQNSPYIVAERATGTGTTLASLAETALSAGAQPTVDGAAFSAALASVGQTTDFALVILDTEVQADFVTAKAWLDLQWANGRRAFLFVGQPVSVIETTRIANAKALNSEKIMLIGNGPTRGTATAYEGYRAAAWAAGKQASLGYTETITGYGPEDGVGLTGVIANGDRAIQAGLAYFDFDPFGRPALVYDTSTLSSLSGELDEGWMLIQRGRVRTVFMNRVARALWPFKSRLGQDEDGRATVRSAAQTVADQMVREGGLRSVPYPTVIDDPNFPATGDRYYFKVDGDDLPRMNFIFGSFEFRNSPPPAVNTVNG